MGLFAIPTMAESDLPDSCNILINNINLFVDHGSAYDYLIDGFAMNNILNMINVAELANQEIGFKPINLNPNCNISERIMFIKECIQMFKDNGYKGLSILYTIKGELALVGLQLKEIDPERM
jgi:hypothetical protein